jgi:hypothetical protein
MAITTKTIEYAFGTYNQIIADNTSFSFGTHTIYIPETTNRKFRSCILEVFFHDNAVLSTSNLTSRTVTLSLGGTNATFVDASTDTSTGENMSFLYSYDFTRHFNDFFGTGSNQTVNINITYDYSQASTSTINACAKLIITYEHETNGATTQIKTVRIPLDALPNNRLNSSTLQSIGTIPIISDWLPESSKTIRDCFLTTEGNTINTGQGQQSWALGCSITGGVPLSGGNGISPLLTALYTRHIFSFSGNSIFNTGAANTLIQFITGVPVGSGIQFRYVPLNNLLTITYEYNESNSNRILNSLSYLYDINTIVGTNVVGSGFALQKNINIQESGINFINSAVRINFCHQLSAAKLSVGVNNYNPINYALDAGSAVAGGYNLMYRLDSGNMNGTQNIFTNWDRGSNQLTITGSVSGTVGGGTIYPQAMHAVIYLNYISDKHPSGSHRHAHTIIDSIYTASGVQALNTYLRNRSGLMLNDTSPYYINNLAIHGIATASSAATSFSELFVKNIDTDVVPMGWTPILNEANNALSEMQTYYIGQNIGDLFKRYDEQPEEGYKLKFNTTREFLSYKGYVNPKNIYYIYNTYHTINSLISGNLINYSGNGSGVTVNVMSSSDNKLLRTIISQNNGIFTGIWYDNTTSLYTTAIQNESYLGRSLTGNALMLS